MPTTSALATLGILIASTLGTAGLHARAEEDPVWNAAHVPMVGAPAPPIAGPALLDGPGAVAQVEFGGGRPVLVSFFASWCAPCRVEHPTLMRLARESGLTVVGINVRDTPEAGRAFLAALGNPYALVVVDTTGAIAAEWGSYSLPESYLVDGSGMVVHKVFGPILPARLEELLEMVGAS